MLPLSDETEEKALLFFMTAETPIMGRVEAEFEGDITSGVSGLGTFLDEVEEVVLSMDFP
jgi:hypothetical protein